MVSGKCLRTIILFFISSTRKQIKEGNWPPAEDLHDILLAKLIIENSIRHTGIPPKVNKFYNIIKLCSPLLFHMNVILTNIIKINNLSSALIFALTMMKNLCFLLIHIGCEFFIFLGGISMHQLIIDCNHLLLIEKNRFHNINQKRVINNS